MPAHTGVTVSDLFPLVSCQGMSAEAITLTAPDGD
jgi:hypothetical protein